MKYLTIFLHLVVTIVSMLLCELHLWEVLRISRSCMHCSCLIMRPPHAIACSSPNDPRTKTDTPSNENMSALVTFACGMLIKHFNNPSLALLRHLPKAILLASKTNSIFSWNHPAFHPNLPQLCAGDIWTVQP